MPELGTILPTLEEIRKISIFRDSIRERRRFWGPVQLSSTLKNVSGNNFSTFSSKILFVGSSFYWGISPILFGGQSSGVENFSTFPSGGYAHGQQFRYATFQNPVQCIPPASPDLTGWHATNTAEPSSRSRLLTTSGSRSGGVGTGVLKFLTAQ